MIGVIACGCCSDGTVELCIGTPCCVPRTKPSQTTRRHVHFHINYSTQPLRFPSPYTRLHTHHTVHRAPNTAFLAAIAFLTGLHRHTPHSRVTTPRSASVDHPFALISRIA